jgi:hypothetical protein
MTHIYDLRDGHPNYYKPWFPLKYWDTYSPFAKSWGTLPLCHDAGEY